MEKHRLAAFTDGVIAVIITIMVLELKPPHDASLAALTPLAPVFLSYVLSFIYVAIYWNNHHHLLSLVKHINGGIMWATMHLMFWLSLIPFTTAWAGENHFETMPIAVYGGVLLMAGLAWYLMQTAYIRANGGPESDLAKALGKDLKGKISPLFYLAGIACAFWLPWLGDAFYVLVAALWLIPDPRIERAVHHADADYS